MGRAGERVLFADMASVGANPGRIIPAWQDFLVANSRVVRIHMRAAA